MFKKKRSKNIPIRTVQDTLNQDDLQQMSAAQLYEEVERMMDSAADKDFDAERLERCLAILQERAPIAEKYAPAAQWGKLVTEHPLLFMEDASDSVEGRREDTVSYPHRKRNALRRICLVAAVIALLGVGMVGAQAAGLDVFGALARWTEETFHFQPASTSHSGKAARQMTEETAEYYTEIQAAVDACGITETLVPTWYPEGFVMGEVETSETRMFKRVSCFFEHPDGRDLSLAILQYGDMNSMAALTMEKDAEDVERYTAGNKTFYIFENLGSVTAAWASDNLLETFCGTINRDEMKSILDSIGEV